MNPNPLIQSDLMQALVILFLLLFINPTDTKEYSSVTEVYTITIPAIWKVEVEHKRTEIYFRDDAYMGKFEIAVRPFLAKTNAKAEYYNLREIYTDAHLTRLNDIQVVISTQVDEEGNKEYNWVFYHDKYEVWCQYLVVDKSVHDDEVQEVETVINSMRFYEID